MCEAVRLFVGRVAFCFAFAHALVRGQYTPVEGRDMNLYSLVQRPICRLLLRAEIKVANEWQISLDYVRGSNIYVRGYLDLRVWSLRLRV